MNTSPTPNDDPTLANLLADLENPLVPSHVSDSDSEADPQEDLGEITNEVILTQIKQCSICGEQKPLSAYSRCNETLDKRCKKCVSDIKNNEDRERRPREKDLAATQLVPNIWQGGKIKGTVFSQTIPTKTGGTLVYRLKVGKTQLTFNTKKYPSIQACEEAAQQKRRLLSNITIDPKTEMCLTTNRYKLIFNEHNMPIYVIVQLSQKNVTLVDYDQLENVKQYHMLVTHSSNKNSSNYCIYIDENSDNAGFHNLISGFAMVDHINRYPLDNRLANLRATSYSENNKNRMNFHKTTKQTGVGYELRDHAFRGRIKKDGVESAAWFSINKYGYEQANAMAKEWRSNQANQSENFINKIGETEPPKHPDYERLKREFEDIMTDHAEGFIWKPTNLVINTE
jgi:hypothetical protein